MSHKSGGSDRANGDQHATTSAPAGLAAVPEEDSSPADGLARAKAALKARASAKKHIVSSSQGFWGCGLLSLGSPNRVAPSIGSFSERMVALLVRSSLDLFYITADDGDLLFASVTVARFLGWTVDELRR